jgi:hypothetical protein
MSSEESMMHYSECMQTMEDSVANNTDAFSVVSHQYDIEGETMLSCNVVTAIVNGVEMVIAPAYQTWHAPFDGSALGAPVSHHKARISFDLHGCVTWMSTPRTAPQ